MLQWFARVEHGPVPSGQLDLITTFMFLVFSRKHTDVHGLARRTFKLGRKSQKLCGGFWRVGLCLGAD